MKFRPGQKVVYVDKVPWYMWPFVRQIPGSDLTIGKVYTVSATYNYGFGRRAIDLVETPCRPSKDALFGYVAYAFRPAIEKETDISIFTSMVMRWDTVNFVCTYVAFPLGWYLVDIVDGARVSVSISDVAFLFIVATFFYGFYNWLDTAIKKGTTHVRHEDE